MMDFTCNRIGRRNPRGSTLVYVTVSLLMICGFLSFMVDLGRVQLAKTQLQRAADAAARAGVSQIAKREINAVRHAAISYAAMNPVDGKPLTLNPAGDLTPGYDSDLQYGYWNVKSRTFTPLYGYDVYRANAVKVTARKRGNDAIPLMFAGLLGKKHQNVQAVAIATLAGGEAWLDVHGVSNPWFSGMPEGTHGVVPPGEDDDYHGSNTTAMINQSVDGIYVYEGARMTFSATGRTTNDKVNKPLSRSTWGPDGEVNARRMFTKGDRTSLANQREHGISPITAPPNALIGVFLTDQRPDEFARENPERIRINPADCPTDYTNPATRDWLEYRPALQQVFFIGDGLTSRGERQTFVAPPGATRLFLGSLDEWEWNNNDGVFKTRVYSPEKIVLVK